MFVFENYSIVTILGHKWIVFGTNYLFSCLENGVGEFIFNEEINAYFSICFRYPFQDIFIQSTDLCVNRLESTPVFAQKIWS